jgi:K+-sensing histidine kinase KdpD
MRCLVTTDVLAFLAAAVLGFFARDAAGRIEQGARAVVAAGAAGPTAEADRMRAALLAAVSHDLRSPLAAAAAAVSCLRSPDLQLMAGPVLIMTGSGPPAPGSLPPRRYVRPCGWC